MTRTSQDIKVSLEFLESFFEKLQEFRRYFLPKRLGAKSLKLGFKFYDFF